MPPSSGEEPASRHILPDSLPCFPAFLSDNSDKRQRLIPTHTSDSILSFSMRLWCLLQFTGHRRERPLARYDRPGAINVRSSWGRSYWGERRTGDGQSALWRTFGCRVCGCDGRLGLWNGCDREPTLSLRRHRRSGASEVAAGGALSLAMRIAC